MRLFKIQRHQLSALVGSEPIITDLIGKIGHKYSVGRKYSWSSCGVSSGNWHEFLDLQSGIWAYAWRGGSEVCGSDVFDWVDPFAHLLDPAMWTYQGLIRDVLMPDGHYYFSVEAVNKVIYGGSLITSICHPESLGKIRRRKVGSDQYMNFV